MPNEVGEEKRQKQNKQNKKEIGEKKMTYRVKNKEIDWVAIS